MSHLDTTKFFRFSFWFALMGTLLLYAFFWHSAQDADMEVIGLFIVVPIVGLFSSMLLLSFWIPGLRGRPFAKIILALALALTLLPVIPALAWLFGL